MSIKPLIFLFFAWLLWGGIVAQNVLSQNSRNQQEVIESKLQSQGQMLEWFFQERTLQLKGFHDEEPIVSRYSQEQWKKMDPWKGIVFLKGSHAYLYGAFDKMMPQAHRKQLTEGVRRLRPAGRIDGVHWDAFQWNGSAFIVAFVSRGQEAQAFIALADDWGRSLSLISQDSGWYLTNQAGRIVFHSDVRYVGEKRPQSPQAELSRQLSTTNLIGRLQVPAAKSTASLIVQLILITIGMALISSVLLTQLLKKERRQGEKQMEAMKKHLLEEHQRKMEKVAVAAPPPPVSNDLLFKDLSHRVASSLGRQLQPSLINILGQAQWLISVSEGRNNEEKTSIEAVIREARQSKNILDKLLAVAGEKDLHKFPMKLETPVLRTLKRWEPEFLHENITVEKEIEDTSFFPLNSEALEKALSHLFQNSVEALIRRLDKKIKIEIRDEGPTLLLAVEDNGGGMEPHHMALVSDPFFTTKNHQNRLGLGLTEAFGIFKQHHAIVTLTSEIGKGARFEIRFDKNAAQTLIEKSADKKSPEEMEFPEGFIVIPQNLPRPLEVEAQKEEPLVPVSQAVDDEIEKLLELTDLDFIESPDREILGDKLSTTDDAAEEEASAKTDFLDANPLSANPFEPETEASLKADSASSVFEKSSESAEDSTGEDEEDEFKMTGISSRGLNA